MAVAGVPGATAQEPRLPCGIPGPALDLGDGSRYEAATGRLRIAMIFVDFSDAPASAYPDASPEEAYARLVPGAAEAYRKLSYGKLDFDVTPHLRWVRMPEPLEAYGLDRDNQQSPDRHRRYIRDALRAASDSFDLSGYRTVFVMAGPGAERRGGTANMRFGEEIEVAGAKIGHAMTLNSYGPSVNPQIIAHEAGHILGLPDYYDVYSGRPDLTRWVGAWDIMSDPYQNVGMLSWTRRLVGWLGDRHFKCVRAPATVSLTPVGVAGGTKAAVVRIGTRRAYVFEARHNEGELCPASGVLVYRVDMAKETGRGPVEVMDAVASDQRCGPHTGALFKPPRAGVSNYKNRHLAMTVLSASGGKHRVRLRAARR